MPGIRFFSYQLDTTNLVEGVINLKFIYQDGPHLDLKAGKTPAGENKIVSYLI